MPDFKSIVCSVSEAFTLRIYFPLEELVLQIPTIGLLGVPHCEVKSLPKSQTP